MAAMRGSAVSDSHPLTMRPLRAGEEPAPHLHGRQNCDSLWSVENRRQARPETACSGVARVKLKCPDARWVEGGGGGHGILQKSEPDSRLFAL